jgi:hypothetical protein
MHIITWTVDHFGTNAEIRCTEPLYAECRSACEPCMEQEIDGCWHPKVDMGRCLASEQIHEDEVVDSYGAPNRATIADGEINVYQRHGKWLWEYVDRTEDVA